MSFIEDIKHAYKNATIAEKLIYINVLVYILTVFASSFSMHWFSLPSNFEVFTKKPWTVLTYGLLHLNFPHILFNMIFLYYIGNLFLDFFTSKQFLNYFILGTLLGGTAFLLLNTKGYLVGASAGIMAILVGLATKIPTYEIRFNLIGSVKLWVIAMVYIVISIVGLDGTNYGGNIAHLGGALLGFIYTKQLEKGSDIGKIVENSINFITNLIKPSTKSNLKTVYKNKNIKRKPTHKETNAKQQKINTILDKISKFGYESLSKEEKDFLFKSGE